MLAIEPTYTSRYSTRVKEKTIMTHCHTYAAVEKALHTEADHGRGWYVYGEVIESP